MLRLFLLTLLGCAFVVAAPLPAQLPGSPFTIDGEGFARLQDAVDSIGEGSGTIVVAPGRHRQCAVQEAGEIVFATREPGSAALDGIACEGKAALVLRGAFARVEGLVFSNIRVPDENGAGIRLEAGNLEVSGAWFADGENGILVASDHDGDIIVDSSTFAGLGRCPEDAGCSHAIYNSGSGRLQITRSRFEGGTGGHYVKSRSPSIHIADSSFDDSDGRGTNYMIDLPDGASGTILRNHFVQGANKENYSAFIMVAAEGTENDSANLIVTDNRAALVPGLSRRTAFLASASHRPRLERNQLGPQIALFEQR